MVAKPYTEAELIAQLKELEARWPRSHWLYAGDGDLNLMRCDKDGKPAMTEFGSVAKDHLVDSFNIRADGGDW